MSILIPQQFTCEEVQASLVGCRTLNAGGSADFGEQVLALTEKLQNQTASSGVTSLDGLVFFTDLETTNLIASYLYPYTAGYVTFTSPIEFTSSATLTTRDTVVVVTTATTGGILLRLLQSLMGTTSQLTQSIIGKNTSTNNSGLVRFVGTASNPYLNFILSGSNSGLRLHPTFTNVITGLQVNGKSVGPINTIATTSSTPFLSTWSSFTTNAVRVDVNFDDLSLTSTITSGNTIFLRVGTGTNILSTAGVYNGGLTYGNYDYELSPPGWIFNNTTNGISLFSDGMKTGYTLHGSVSFYKVGTISGGERWVYKVVTFCDATGSSYPRAISHGFGYIQMPSTSPIFSGISLFAFGPVTVNGGFVNVLVHN